MSWSRVAADFEWDGAWRDIYVLDATLADWQAALELLRAWDPRPRFYTGGEAARLPDLAKALFPTDPDAFRSTLEFDVEGLQLNCHFFSDDEIEFDLDPREVNASRFEALCGFMRLLATAVGKPVLLTHENERSSVILRSLPGS